MARTATRLTAHELALHARLTSHAAQQGGVVSALQARSLGALDGDIRRLISAGMWTRPRRSVYADRNYRSTTPAPVHADVCAATLAALDSGVVVSHLSAVHLLGLPTTRAAPEVVSLTRRPPCHGNDAAGTDIHVAEFDDANVVVLSGIPVLAGARLVIDCCQTMDPPDALAVADGVLRAGIATPDDLRRAVLDCSGIPFTRSAALVVSRSDPLSENWFESVSRWWLLEAGLPRPQLQVPLQDKHGVVRARLDMLLADPGIAGEADGRGKYDGPDGLSTLIAEKEREDWIRHEHGLEVVRWIPAEMASPRGRAGVMSRWWDAMERANERRNRR